MKFFSKGSEGEALLAVRPFGGGMSQWLRTHKDELCPVLQNVPDSPCIERR